MSEWLVLEYFHCRCHLNHPHKTQPDFIVNVYNFMGVGVAVYLTPHRVARENLYNERVAVAEAAAAIATTKA